MKNVGLSRFMVVILAVAVSGCTSTYNLDLGTQRKVNLAEDMAEMYPKAIELPETLTLENAITIGLENNLDMRVSEIMAQMSDDELAASKLRMLPELNARGEISRRSDYEIKEYENLDTGERMLGRSISDEKTRETASIALSWNILDFGLSYIRSRQAAMGNEIQRMERLRQAQKLAFDISAAYWKSVLAEQELEYVEKVRTELGDYKEKAGEVSGKAYDAITSKMMEKKLVEMAIAANKLQADISGVKIELCRLMGISPASQFSLKGIDFRSYVDQMPNPADLDSKKLEMIALNNRPELFAADLQYKIQQDEARAVLVSMFPGIRFDVGQYYDGNTYLVDNSWNTVGVGMAINLLSLPSKFMQFKARNKSAEMSKTQRLMLSAGIIAQTHMALHDFMVKKQQFDLYEESQKISDDLLGMSRDLKDKGKATEIVLTQRLVEGIVTRLERDRSIIDLLNSYNMLLVSLGLDYERWKENPMTISESVPSDIGTRDTLFADDDFFQLPDTAKDAAPQPEKELTYKPEEPVTSDSRMSLWDDLRL